MIYFFKTLLTNCMWVCFIGVVSGIIFAYIPAKAFRFTEKLLKTLEFEKNGRFYDKYFKISVWKDKLPQFSNIIRVGFHLNNLEIKSDEYLERFKIETLRAEITHIFLIIISPVFYYLNENSTYGIIYTLLYIIGNIPFLMIQRFNRPRIEHLQKMIEKRKIKSEHLREKQRKAEKN